MTEPKNEPNPWVLSVQKAVGDRAYTMVYDIGFQCQVLPLRSDEGAHTMEIRIDMTHSGFPFDLTWRVSFTDRTADGIVHELLAPEHAGGSLWKQGYASVEELAPELAGLPFFIRGYFVGRETAAASAAPAAPGSEG